MNKSYQLLKYIESQIGIPFELGKNDCVLFVAGAIDAMEGTKLKNKYEGLWKNQDDVNKYSKKNKSVSEVLNELGYKAIGLNFIQTGDILIMEQEDNRTFAIFTGSKVAIFTEKGLILVAIKKVRGILEVLRCLS